MSFCKSGEILNYCHPNALMTLAEYLVDYAAPSTREKGFQMIQAELARIPDARRRKACAANIREIESGNARDFRF